MNRIKTFAKNHKTDIVVASVSISCIAATAVILHKMTEGKRLALVDENAFDMENPVIVRQQDLDELTAYWNATH